MHEKFINSLSRYFKNTKLMTNYNQLKGTSDKLNLFLCITYYCF